MKPAQAPSAHQQRWAPAPLSRTLGSFQLRPMYRASCKLDRLLGSRRTTRRRRPNEPTHHVGRCFGKVAAYMAARVTRAEVCAPDSGDRGRWACGSLPAWHHRRVQAAGVAEQVAEQPAAPLQGGASLLDRVPGGAPGRVAAIGLAGFLGLSVVIAVVGGRQLPS